MDNYRPTIVNGFSLIELLIALAILAILASIATPSFYTLVQHNRSDAVQSALKSAIYTTRSIAISQKVITTFCPYAETACGEDWSKGGMIFSDANNNRIIDDDDRLLEKIDFDNSAVAIQWRASAGRNFLRYSPTGMAREFGRFSICSKNNDLRYARGIVINRQGRLRTFKDRDRDGVVEDIDGKVPKC